MQPEKLTPVVRTRSSGFASKNRSFYPLGILRCTGVMVALAIATASQLAQAAVLESWRFDRATGQLEIVLDDGTTPRYSVLDRPPLIVVDLPNTQLGRVSEQRTYSGAVRQIRVSQFQPQLARITIELAPEVVLSPARVQLQQVETGRNGRTEVRWLLRPLIAGVESSVSARREGEPELSFDKDPNDVLIEYGEPLPDTAPAQLPPRVLPDFAPPTPSPEEFTEERQPDSRRSSRRASNARLLEGTTMILYYPGETDLVLKGRTPRQEVLLLEEELRDRFGRRIAPANTPVIGRFETDSRGSRFIAQAMRIRGRNVPISARSERLSRERQVSGRRVARNSGIGAAAGLLIGGISGVGLLAGAAVAATATVLASPQPVTIPAGQIVEVRLTEDWR